MLVNINLPYNLIEYPKQRKTFTFNKSYWELTEQRKDEQLNLCKYSF